MLAKARHLLDNISDRTVILILAAVACVFLLLSFVVHILDGETSLVAWVESLSQNMGAGMAGALLTFYLIDMLRSRRQEREAKEEEETESRWRLTRDLSSNVRDVAVQATNVLRAHGWGFGEDTSLIGMRLSSNADLQGADLTGVKLQGAELAGINLQEAELGVANLQGAILAGVNLHRAILYGANLQGANLTVSNLQEANLYGAKLQRAILARANLKGADLVEAKLEGAQGTTYVQLQMAGTLLGATLPDGTKLPNNGTWREVFEKWCETVKTDKNGYILAGENQTDDLS